jgi:hypothetical protein
MTYPLKIIKAKKINSLEPDSEKKSKNL